MKFVIATSSGFHLRHLALQLHRLGQEVEFHSWLPRWKTRQYGLPDSITRSWFLRLFPFSALVLLRGLSDLMTPLRFWLCAPLDRLIARKMSSADVFVGLSALTIESARKARQQGALVLIERSSSHVDFEREAALAAGTKPPSEFYSAREKASYEAANSIVLLSQFTAGTFLDRGFAAEHLELQRLGVDLTAFTPAPAPPPLPVSAIYVGLWSRRKGCDMIAPLLDEMPGLRLTHVGSMGDAPVPGSERFRSRGHLDHASLARELQRHHVLLFPSRDDGFGMVMIEALASGLRVVASSASGGPDLADMLGSGHVTVFPAGDLAAFCSATRGVLEDVAAGPAARQLAPDKREALGWQAYGKRYLDMATRLVAARA